ncbi:MAG TPA: LCP family protein [Acidimicrobiales bacterium]
MADSGTGSSGPTDGSRSAKKRALANEHRLVALGEAVDRKAGQTPKRRRKPRRRGRTWIIAGLSVIVLVAGVIGGSYLYANIQFDRIKKFAVPTELPKISGKPFNILMIGSDSRAGLSGLVARQSGATKGAASGQRSDVVKIVHVDPAAGTISMLSIPRDTMTTLLAQQNLYGKYNRINVNFDKGPSLLVQTITANFGIPINDTIIVSFAGMINAADAIGGVYLDFPYPARDLYSGLKILHTGCQQITGFEALAVVRSRHYEWFEHGVWNSDVTSDFGRIWRQNVFLRGMVDRAKGIYNPLTINSFLSKLPQGISLDNNFSLNELIGLAVKFHSINPAAIQTITMPDIPGTYQGNDVEFVQEPEAQQALVKMFGSELITPTNPPPINSAGQTPLPPHIAIPTTTTTIKHATTTVKHAGSTATTTSTTTTTIPPEGDQFFDPRVCTP